MRRIKDLSNIWSTVRELDVRDIQAEAEQPVRLALVGNPDMRDKVAQALRSGAERFPPRGNDPLDIYDAPLVREQTTDLHRADLVLLALDGTEPLAHDMLLTFEKLAVVSAPFVVLCFNTTSLPAPATGVPRPDWQAAEVMFVPPAAAQTQQQVIIAKAVTAALPEALHIAAARRLPGLRTAVANALIHSVSMANASYSLTSGIPEMIPVLNLPLNAADMLVLTKNQALMSYRIALAMGAEVEFRTMIRELLSVIGSGFLWRQLARQLVGLIPGVGILPKVAVAYAGTYTAGEVAERYYRSGELVSRETIRTMVNQALQEGRERARALLPDAAADGDASTEKQPGLIQRTVKRVRSWLPGGADASAPK